MIFLSTVKYSKEHTWLQLAADNTAVVGISDFAQNNLGEIVFVDVPTPGQKFSKDEVFGSIEALKTTSELYMPVGGEIIESNLNLKEQPTLINEDPFNSGWIVKIKITSPQEIEELLDDKAYKAMAV